MNLNSLQSKLFEYVKEKHGSQVRKYTGEPYYNHLLNVAKITYKHEPKLVEVALCHDLFEDTTSNFDELYKKMVSIGYDRDFSYDTCTRVKELTDKYTKEEFPYLNRKKRKESEALRLSKTSYQAQSVKYADLIDNTSSILTHDPKFAEVYLEEKKLILSLMTNGNKKLLELCKRTVLQNSPKNTKANPTTIPPTKV